MDCPFHQTEGGHQFNGGVAFPIERCSSCVGGICRCALACELPEPQPQPAQRHSFLPQTREAWGRAIGAALGFGGACLFAQAGIRHLLSLT